jgi:hypothetical protein
MGKSSGFEFIKFVGANNIRPLSFQLFREWEQGKCDLPLQSMIV